MTLGRRDWTDFLQNWDLVLAIGMMPNFVLGIGKGEDKIWEIAGSYKTFSRMMDLILFNKDKVL